MGKHDKTLTPASEEFYKNRIERLEAEKAELKDRLALSQGTISKQKEMLSRMSKWNSDDIAEKDERIAELEAKIVKLVSDYV